MKIIFLLKKALQKSSTSCAISCDTLKEFVNFSKDKERKTYAYINPNFIKRLEDFCEYLIKNLSTKKESLVELNTYNKPLVKTLSDDILNLIPIILFLPHIPITLNHLTYRGVGLWLGKPDNDWLINYIFYIFNESYLILWSVLLIFLSEIINHHKTSHINN